MALIPESWIIILFSRSKWFYKTGFSYLFKNPLWNKPIPANGFTLCPYFWTTLFSLTFFRVFVGMVLTLRFAVNFFRVTKAFNWMDTKCHNYFFKNQREYRSGVAILLAILNVLGVVAISILGLTILIPVFEFFNEANRLPLLFLSVSLLLGFITCLMGHKFPNGWLIFTQSKWRKIFWCFFGIVMGITVALYPQDSTTTVFSIFEAIGEVISYIFNGLVDIILFCCKWFWGLIVHTALLLISAWILSLVVIGICTLASYLWYRAGYPKKISLNRKLKGARESVEEYLYPAIFREIYKDNFYYKSYSFWQERMQASPIVRKYLKETVQGEAWLQVSDKEMELSIGPDRVQWLALALIQELKDEEARIARYAQTHKEFLRKIEKSKFVIVTEKIAVASAKKIGGGCHHIAKYVKAFFAIGWELIKAKKNKACPYVQFID
jgi:hypothetical protein